MLTARSPFLTASRSDGANTSHVKTVAVSGDRELVASGDADSHIKLFNYPCVVEDAPFDGPRFAHASHVERVVFAVNDSYLISAGGTDRTMMLWRVEEGDDRGRSHRGVAPPPRNKWVSAGYGKPPGRG